MMQFEELSEGSDLPEVEFPLTASSIVATAIATNDFENVHHDKAAAQATGVPDIFMNILSTNGIVQRYVCAWAGPSALVKKIGIKLGAPNFVGDTMKLTGTVAQLDAESREAQVQISGRNQIGEHVGATITLQFPERKSA